MKHFCECGCGEETKQSKCKPYNWNRFIHGHQNRTKRYWNMQKEPKLCACGCGKFSSPGKKYKQGHTPHTDATKIKMSKTHKNIIFTKEHKANISKSKIGKSNQNKGRTFTKEHCINLSKAQSGKIHIHQMKPRIDGYCDAWSDEEYKNDLRKSACERCGITNMMNLKVASMQLHNHHIKKRTDCSPDDIQTLCTSCHAKTEWEKRRKN